MWFLYEYQFENQNNNLYLFYMELHVSTVNESNAVGYSNMRKLHKQSFIHMTREIKT